ncbi:MAG: stage II sporulation protein M [Anaerolineae bacterium]|nr:stage II sporulation protein M [Anaerolineae bacterium]
MSGYQVWIWQTWNLVRRELRDSLRDWRILFPIFAMTVIFPLLMRFATSYLETSFYERWGAEGVQIRLLPLMLLLVGFLPISVSLVIALESFVGEKERLSLEPLLASPLSDLQLYLGKLVASLLLPWLAGATGIAFYLLILQSAWRPSPLVILQVLLLTMAKALVMVSGAVIVSSHTTSVRAANLLSSFLIVPVALLIQGESLMVLYHGYSILWYVFLFLIVANILLVRMGFRLFNREALLGREIDQLDLRGGWRLFRKHLVWPWWFFGLPRERLPRALRPLGTLVGLYLREVPAVVGRSRLALLVTLLGLVGAFWIGRDFALRFPLPAEYLPLNRIDESVFRNVPAIGFLPAFTFRGVLENNIRALLLASLLGTLSFGSLAVVLLMAPLAIIFYIAFPVAWAGYNPFVFLATFILPHGVFELPAAILATALAVRLGATFVAPPRGMTVGEGWFQALADFVKVFLGLVIPLLALAAWIEVTVTPALVIATYGK